MSAPNRPRRVLFIQGPAGGGSMTCLIALVRSLDRDRLEPVGLTYQRDTGYEEVLESLGVSVLSLDRSPRPKATKSGSFPGYVTVRAGIDGRVELRDSVCFSGFGTDVPSIMAAADLVVHTATWPEPFGKVLVEAMASRAPVVATAVGGPLEIVEEGITGLLVPPSDPDALAAALIRMASDPAGSKAMGERARAVAEERYGVDGFRRTMDRIFTDALERVS